MKAIFFKAILVLIYSGIGLYPALGQDFQQQFTGGIVGDYDDGTANEFNAISTSGAGLTWSINSNRLRAVRTGNAGAATRTTNLTGIEAGNTAMLRFKFNVVSSSGAQTNAGIIYLGKSFTTANGTEANADVHARIGFNFTATSGTFQFREIGSSTNTGNFTGEQSVLLVTNNSGSSKTYQAPNGTYESVANDRFDVWVGTSRVFNDATATDAFASNSISDFKIVFTAGSGTIEVDDILIDPIPEPPTATAATLVGSGGFTANWGVVAGSTGYRLDVSTSNLFSSFVSGYNNLAVTGTSQAVTGLSASTTYYYRVRAERAYSVATNTSNHSNTITASTSAGSPTITLSSPSQTGASNINPSTNDNILSHFQAAVTAANATLNSLEFSTTGTYNASDLTGNFSLFYHTTSTFGSASSIATVAVGAAGTYTFSSLTQAINSGTTGYFWIVANSSASAGGSRTLTVSANPTLTFASGSPTGTITAGGTKTFTNLVPSIAISGSSPAASNHNAGTTNVVLKQIDLAVTVTDATLTGLTVTTAGTYAAADLTNLKVRYSTDATLDGGDATLSTKTTGLAAGSHVFPSFTSQSITSGSTGYLFITADIASSATGGNTLNLGTTAFSNITFSAGIKTGTDPVAAGNTRTIVNPSIAISGNSPAASTHLQSSTDIVLKRLDLAVSSSNATLTGISVTTAGTYISSDVTNLKVRYSTDATLDGGDATLSTLTTPGVAGSKTFPSFTSQVINSGSTGYIFITADLSATATSGNTISLGTTAFSNLNFSLGNKTGTDPVAAGNTRTFIKAEPANFPTSFACGTTTTTSIPLNWTAATGTPAPDGYLVKWSATSYAAITAPTDGTAEPNGTGVHNVTGTTHTFSSLTSGTTYFFKIWSYTNSGSNINYKLVGEPQTSCATLSAPWEDIETGSKGSYAAADVTLTSGSWNLSDALIGTSVSDRKNGSQSIRMQNTGIARMNFDRTSGIGTVDILHAIYGSDGSSTWRLEASTDGGSSWTAYVSSTITTSSITLTNQSFVVNLSGNVRFRIVKLSGGGNRISFDDFYVTNFAGCTPPAATTAVSSSNPTSGGIDLSWTGASGDGTMLVLRETASANQNPVNGTSYTANTAWASAEQINSENRVMFRASGSSVTGITGLSAQTQYTATAYNYNNTGVCYRIAGAATTSFRTLSLEPTAHAASFTSTADSPTQITLSFSPASSITNADGYLIFRRTGAAPTFTPSDANAYTVGSIYGDAVLRALITSTSVTSFVDNSGLSGSNTYHYILVPYNWDGTNAVTYNYRTAVTIPATNATTPAALPEIQLEQPIATNVACGYNYDFGSKLVSSNTDITIRVRNLGTGTLNISSVDLTGVDASEFSIQTFPSSTINAGNFDDMVIRFSPVTGGSKVAKVTLNSDDGDEAACEINLYGEGDATPVVPTLTSPTVSAIVNTSATLGATLTSDGNAAITARGTVWKATAGVTASDNPLAEGGTSVAAFSHSRTSLPAGTRIFYRGYATNSAGTGLSPESDFYTLSNEPAAGPATFTATSISATQINLAFSAASSIPASGYVILIKTGSAVTGAPNDATAYALNDLVGDANVVALITTGTTFSVTGLSASTNYHFAIFPFSWNGTNNQTRNYRISTPSLASATTGAASLPVLGDIAFVAYATDSPDRFAFVALADIAANAEIGFTDNAWSSSSALCTNEETVRWKAPAVGVPKGTVVRIQGPTANVGSIVSGNLSNLSNSGDQIFAYTGTAGSPTFIAGLSSTTFLGTCQACGVNTNASCLATGLTNGTNAISFVSHADNGYYNGETYGTALTLRTAINNPANWVRSSSNQTWPTPWSFVIGNVSITTGTIIGSPFCITNSTGMAVSVPFSTGGTFETGNVFTAQLSDATGSFAIPVDIGTGTTSPISATIPAGKPSGSGYRIRVVSSDPEANGLANTSNLTIFLNTPDATGVSALRQNGGAIVSWTNPGGCWDQVLVVTQPTNAHTALPTGDGTLYTANTTFLSGTSFGTGGSVVYKGTGSNVTITGYTNSTTYFVKVFVRRGTVWSDGVEISVVPSPDVTGDFRSRVATGNWSDFNTWERYNGTSWVNATSGQFPDNTTTTVTVQAGHTIVVDGSSDPYDVRNLIVASGGKLYANLTTGNRYLSVFGDITCNGAIGNGSTFDGISFNFEGSKATVSGTGTFDCSRMRKSTRTPNSVTDLILAMNVNLRWNNSSGTAIYNNVGGTAGSRFNVTVNENSTLSCILSTGGTSGNASIDGVDGGNSASDRAAGTFTINGTMNIPGTLFATTDNDATGGFFCRWVIGSTGVINCRQLDCSASGAAGHTLEIKQGGKLNINNNNDNTVNPIVNFSTTNNTYTFETASVIEYSSTDLVGSQKIFINSGFPYRNLLLSGPSTKQLQTAGTLTVNGNLTISGGVLDIQSNDIDLKGNWQNYNQSGFTEGSQKVTFSGTGLQTVTCLGGEQFYNVDVTNTSVAGVRLDADVTLANDLDLGSNGRLSFGPTPTNLFLSKMTAGSNTLKGSGTANIDMSAAEHVMVMGCPDPGFSGTLNAGATSTIIYNRDEDFAGSTDDQNVLTGFAYANLILTGKGNKVISNNLTVNGNFTAETPDLVISVPVSNRTFTLGGNFTLNSGATMNDNCRLNQEIITSGNALQVFNTNTKNLKALNLKSVKTAGGISLNGEVADQTTVNLQNDFGLDYTGSAVFSDNGNSLFIGDDAELGSASSAISNFNFTGTMQFNGLGAAVDIHLSDYAGTGRCRAQLNHVIIRAGENATTDQLEVYPTAGGQAITVKGNLEIIEGPNDSELDMNGNTLNLRGNWTSYDENAFNEGTTSTVVFNGTTAQTITVPTKEKFANLTWDNTNALNLGSDLEVVTNLSVSDGSVTTGIHKVILGSAATITETDAHHVAGRVQTTRTLSLAAHTFGGLGLEIDANGAAPGVTEVNRYTGVVVTGAGNQGIKRRFSIVPATNTGLNAKLVFSYFDSDINGLDENNFQLYRSTDGGIVWNEQSATADPITNSVTKTGINSFSDWTLGDVNTPLPVSLLHFSGKAGKGKADLFWTSASESGNLGFRVFRSQDGQSFEDLGFVKGAGNSTQLQSYTLTDLRFNQSYFYKLVQFREDGKEERSKMIFLDCGCDNKLRLTLYPNPSRGEVHFQANQSLGTEEVFQLELTGMDGRSLYSNHAPVHRLESLLNERLLDLPSGVYQIRLYNTRVQESWRLRRE
jgi:hypothetical protein